MTKPDESAFPRHLPTGYIKANDSDSLFWETQARGMSKREYFAAMAMLGLCIHREMHLEGSSKLPAGNIARMAIAQANALIVELNKEVQP